MSDKYLLKVGIDLDEVQLSKVTGMISNELVSMGKLSEKFVDNALATAKLYNEEINKQKKIISDIDARLKKGGLDDSQMGLLSNTRAKAQKKIDEYTYGDGKKLESKAVVDATANYAKSAQGFSSKVTKAGGSLVSGVSKVAAGLGVAQMVIQMFVKKIGDALEKFSNYANQINPLGAFGSQSQRDIMTRYGMSGNQALGFSNTLSAMHMSEQDIGKMTTEQRRVFDSLQNFWSEGMGKLDPDALDKYTKSMSDYQEVQAKFSMGIQMTIMRLVSGSPKFNEFVGKIEDLLDSVLEFMGSPAAQMIFDGLVDFLTTVVTILEQAMRLISKIPGIGGGSIGGITNNNTSSTKNEFNIYGGGSNDNSELARQISYATQGNYRG